MNYAERLKEDGFFVIEGLFSDQECGELLAYVIDSFNETEPDFIMQSNYRVHSPLQLTPMVDKAVSRIATPAFDAVSDFLRGPQRLVELSSITVFPRAASQILHRDESNEGSFLMSVFVNLAPTAAESGALRIVPGSHKTMAVDYGHVTPNAVEVPIGSAVFMDSKTWHAGGGNETLDRIRPVFYASFGDPALEGPTYSIRPDVLALEKTLSDFHRPMTGAAAVWSTESKPALAPNSAIFQSMNFENEPSFLLTVNGEVTHRITLPPEAHALRDVIMKVVAEPGQHSIAEIAQSVNLESGLMVHFFRAYGVDGWFTEAV